MLPAVSLLPHAVASPQPAGYHESIRLIHGLQARDDASILPICRTALYDHGGTTDLAVVLLHGFTNCPAQYALMARKLHVRGCNVLVPRLPEHGDVDRMTTRLEGLTAQRLVAAATEAIDAALGLGRRLVVSGLSLGGALCAWLATQRSDIDRCVALAPAFGIGGVPYALSVLAAAAMRATPPSRYAWWDNRIKEKITPRHAYPRYPIRTLGESYLIGEWTIRAQPPLAGRARTRMIFALNARDPAVNNDVVGELAQRWDESHMLSSSVHWLNGFPLMHDVIEPENPHQCIATCYPPLIELITAQGAFAQKVEPG